jgi:propanediol dehydratase small subunit
MPSAVWTTTVVFCPTIAWPVGYCYVNDVSPIDSKVMDWVAWVPVIVAGVASSPGVIALVRDVRKSRAETVKLDSDSAKSLADAATSIVEMMKVETADLKKRIELLEEEVSVGKKDRERLHLDIKELAELVERGKQYVLELFEQIKSHNDIPKPIPEILKEENWPEIIK